MNTSTSGNETIVPTALAATVLGDAIASLSKRLSASEDSMDAFFLVSLGSMVLLMHVGFGFLEAGAVRPKNVTTILFRNLLDSLIGGILFWLVGYPIAYGRGSTAMGYTYWAAVGLPPAKFPHWFFQFAFAVTLVTIIAGALSERCSLAAYFCYSVFVTGFMYPFVAHWVWSEDGWLSRSKFHDYAGAGAVHVTAGVAALVAAALLGPRMGRFATDEGLPGHSLPMTGLGGLIITVGFIAFNGGSRGSISRPGDAAAVGRAVVNTIVAGSAGGLVVLVLNKVRGTKHWSFLLTLNGVFVGMVSVCGGCDAFYPWGALTVGGVAGLVYVGARYSVIKAKIDDPLDVGAVHGGGGLWGLIAAPFFIEEGLVMGYKNAFVVLMWNVIGMICIVLWAGCFSLILFGSLKLAKKLRIPREVEEEGMDIIYHGETAYSSQDWKDDVNDSNRRDSTLPWSWLPKMRGRAEEE